MVTRPAKSSREEKRNPVGVKNTWVNLELGGGGGKNRRPGEQRRNPSNGPGVRSPIRKKSSHVDFPRHMKDERKKKGGKIGLSDPTGVIRLK